MQAACVPAWRLQCERMEHTSVRCLHTFVCRMHTSVWSLHTGVMRLALRRYAGCSMLQHAARRSYAGCCSLHADCCNLHTPICRLQPESLGCIRSHFEKCTWLVKCYRFKAARPPRRTPWARLTATCSSDFRLGPHADFLWSAAATNRVYRFGERYITFGAAAARCGV